MNETTQVAESKIEELEQIARKIRRKSLEIIHRAGSGHPGGSLSGADIAAALFFGVMRYDPKNPLDPKRDRFILSKGHATGLLYATLSQAGFITDAELVDYRKINSKRNLSGHPHPKTPGVEIATGSLGQGLSAGHGMALAARLDNLDYRVYVLMGDGELQEGQVWEAAMSAAKFKSTNLVAIVDYNKVAQDSITKDLKDLEPIEDKWRAFGWDVQRIDGHDMAQVHKALTLPLHAEKPRVIIADTVKGKGVSFMEGKTAWHGVAPSDEDFAKAMKELE
ncbi:transketolase [Nitrospina watsonii]|uniref:Transketolase N-terminal section n=1 Tax=Nitrospina watsonii TaxID=1323948 RepID=A0ABM9HDR6_9BACT|nr:transketolase [Nitrospina watsonii]CAI2718332.1 Putative transketolase N-terminal section [Nitrospina watsonii]